VAGVLGAVLGRRRIDIHAADRIAPGIALIRIPGIGSAVIRTLRRWHWRRHNHLSLAQIFPRAVKR
jgi:hypothetical protein